METRTKRIVVALRHSQLIPRAIKKGIKGIFDRRRMNTAAERGLPSFIIIGAQKAGTTSLYRYLMYHPQLYNASIKEVNYFDINYDRGPLWYRSHFPRQERLKDGAITGEASPYYMFHPHAAARIHQALPDVKLIALLRNPVDRALSHYFHEVRRGVEPLPLEEALAREEERLAPELEKMRAEASYRSEAYECYSYKKRGVYVDQLANYATYFSPEQLLILSSEAFFSEPDTMLRKVQGFLGVQPDVLPDNLVPQNAGTYNGKIPDAIYQELTAYFKPYNQQLYDYLGRDFGW